MTIFAVSLGTMFCRVLENLIAVVIIVLLILFIIFTPPGVRLSWLISNEES